MRMIPANLAGAGRQRRRKSAIVIMGSAAWMWLSGCARKAWKARNRLRVVLIAGPSEIDPNVHVTKSTVTGACNLQEAAMSKAKGKVLSESS